MEGVSFMDEFDLIDFQLCLNISFIVIIIQIMDTLEERRRKKSKERKKEKLKVTFNFRLYCVGESGKRL